METKNDGGPAFPALEGLSRDRNDDFSAQTEGGMTLRDYFAAKAMAALMADIAMDDLVTIRKAVAIVAYEMADTMLAARAG